MNRKLLCLVMVFAGSLGVGFAWSMAVASWWPMVLCLSVYMLLSGLGIGLTIVIGGKHG